MQEIKLGEQAESLSTEGWYNTFTEVGFGYGPAFQGLSRLCSYDRGNIIAGDVAL